MAAQKHIALVSFSLIIAEPNMVYKYHLVTKLLLNMLNYTPEKKIRIFFQYTFQLTTFK